MNLMFRKNFREGGKSGGGGGGAKHSKAVNRNQGKRSRDMGYAAMDTEVHYRTHLFFSPSRTAFQEGDEGGEFCAFCFKHLKKFIVRGKFVFAANLKTNFPHL